MALSRLDFCPIHSSTPLKNSSNQTLYAVHFVSTIFLLGSYPVEATSINPLHQYIAPKCVKPANMSRRPGSKLIMIMSTTGLIPKTSLTGRGYNGGS